MPTLILFIDALPYDDLARLPRLAAWPALSSFSLVWRDSSARR